MRCEICNGNMRYDFSKKFTDFGLDVVDYWRCQDCGFVCSRTHAEMSSEAWGTMNQLFHGSYQGTADNPLDPRWMTRLNLQAYALSELVRGQLLDPKQRWVDYGCGDGSLSSLLESQYRLSLLKYDRYMSSHANYLGEGDIKDKSFDFVLTTSVFEHLTRREQWDGIERLVSPNGALGLHTLVTEKVPSDPTWFYLQPPHSAFFSNTAITRLFQDWGYRASIYNVAASLWVWFRSDPKEIAEKVELLNNSTDQPLVYKAGFVDYWKTDPRRIDAATLVPEPVSCAS